MKKLFTLLAFLAVFMGAKADWVDDYKIDYSQKNDFPFYVMGYVPEWVDGVMTDYGSAYRYATQDELDGDGDSKWKDGEAAEGTTTAGGKEYQKVTGAGPYWHQYFIADQIPTEIGGSYTVKAMVKASEACRINVNMGWGWGQGQQAAASVDIPAEWTEVEWDYSDIGGTSCNLVAQPGTVAATIEWKWVTVGHNAKAERPVQWQEWLTKDGQPRLIESTFDKVEGYMGNAETPWDDATVKFDDQTKNYLICAWGKEREVNMNDDGGWDPFPATIEEEGGNKYFIVHGKPAITDGDAAAWDNQFWIQSPKEWNKSGDQVKIHFRYKASKNVTVATQVHKQNPSDYLVWHAIGDVAFTEEWQDFDKVMNIDDDMVGTWSIAFQLNQNDKEAIDFYFDDLSWQTEVVENGYFVAGANTLTGIDYEFADAIEFTEEADGTLSATVGTKGDQSTWVNQVMVSTVRGSSAQFRANTLKPVVSDASPIKDDPDDWHDYAPGSNAKISLPGPGVWTIYLDPKYESMSFEMVEGELIELPEINPNPTEIVINATAKEANAWDNQFWIVSNEVLPAGTETHLKFSYKATTAAKSSTQSHENPGNYIHWAAIGDVNFTDEWQEFEADFTVPSECNGQAHGEDGYMNDFKSIAFNLNEIEEANDYYIKDVVWKLADGTKSLIDQTGTKNFFVKILGENPHEFGKEDTGINDLKVNTVNNGASFNVAGQQVDENYKGLVIKSGKKLIQK